jgi:hypothetical protein
MDENGHQENVNEAAVQNDVAAFLFAGYAVEITIPRPIGGLLKKKDTSRQC